MALRDTVYNMLKMGPVCASDFRDEKIARASARIYELRQDGHPILTRRCTRPWHRHKDKQIEYVLEGYRLPPGGVNQRYGVLGM